MDEAPFLLDANYPKNYERVGVGHT